MSASFVDSQHKSGRLRVGVVGAGFAGTVHARAAVVAGARLVGVAAGSAGSAERAARALGAERAYDDPRALAVSPDVDVLHVCSPNDTHLELSALALDAGKHVVCEKPLARESEGAAALARQAEAAGRIGAVPFVYRYYPMVREARARVAAGQVGRIVLVHGSFLQDWLLGERSNWRVDPQRGGASRAFADIGSHLGDLVEFVTGESIAEVSATLAVALPERPGPAATFSGDQAGGARHPVSTEDIAAVTFRLGSGALGAMLLSQVAAGHRNHLRLDVAGTAGAVAFDQQRPEELALTRDGATATLLRDPARLAPDAARFSRLPAGHPQGFQDCVDAFVGEVHAGVHAGALPPGTPSFADGARSAQLTDAVLRSAAAGGAWTARPSAAAAADARVLTAPAPRP